MPRLKAITYPDADHSAVARPMMRASSPPGAVAKDWIVGSKVLATEAPPALVRMSVTVETVFSACPTRLSSDKMAMSAGKSASTAK
jgi:hypothetical protein